jgi:hypothetical protein
VKTTLLTLLFLVLIPACLPRLDKTSLKLEAPKLQLQEETSADAVSFDKLKTDVLEQKCLGCHKGWSTEAGFQDDKIIVGDAENSKIYQIVRSGRMPVGKKLPEGGREKVPPLESAELNMFYQYITHTKAVYAEVSFEELKTQVLEPKCMTCHKKWGSEEEFLKRNITPGNAAASKLYDSVMAPRMPKSPLNEDGTLNPVVPLSAKEKKLIRNYINNLKPKL